MAYAIAIGYVAIFTMATGVLFFGLLILPKAGLKRCQRHGDPNHE